MIISKLQYCTRILLVVIAPIVLFSQRLDWEIVDVNHAYINDYINAYYYDLKCADSLNCMIYGEFSGTGGFFFRGTTDGGQTWRNLYQDSGRVEYDSENQISELYYPDKIQAVSYPNEKLFIAVGDSGMVVRTTDKGITWERFCFGKDLRFRNLNMYDENYGLCTRKYYKKADLALVRTSDGGRSWHEMNLHIDSTLTGFNLVQMISPDFFIARVQYGLSRQVLLKVRGDFEKWDTVAYPRGAGEMKFIDENTGWMWGGITNWDTLSKSTQLIYKTTDGGKSWESQRDTAFNSFTISHGDFFDSDFGFLGSCSTMNLITTDGGENWKEIYMEDEDYTSGLFYCTKAVQVPSKDLIYILYKNYIDKVYKYRRVVSVEEEPKSRNPDRMIYPNPTTNLVNIKLEQLSLEPINISIYDEMGSLVTTIFDGIAEQTKFVWETEAIPAGVYFCIIKSNNNYRTQKIIVHK